MSEFVYKDCVKLIGFGGAHKHSCDLRNLCTHRVHVPSQLFSLLL